MADRPSPFESQIDAVLRRVEEIDARLRALEGRFTAALPLNDSLAPAQPPAPADRHPARRRFNPLVVTSLTGRTSLVLGGGYLLRALADSGVMPLQLGVVLGFVYAIAWILMADRDGSLGKAESATFHVLAATVLAFPLVYEATARFKLLDVWAASLSLSTVAALIIAVAWRTALQPIVWMVTAADVLTALALVRASHQLAAFVLNLVLLSAMTYSVAVASGWSRVRWLPALVADGAVIWLATSVVAEHDFAQLWPAIWVALALFVTSLASFTIRILVLGGEVIGFEIFQSAAALAVGYGGAVYIGRALGLSGIPFGVAALALGVAAYVAAFGSVAALKRRNFLYVSTLALALVLIGGTLALAEPVVTALWITLALAGAYLGRQFTHGTPSAHGATYLLAATVASGLFLEAGYGLLGPANRPWLDITPIALVALTAAAVFSTISPRGFGTFKGSKIVTTIAAHRASVGWPRALALAVLVLGLTGIVIVWIAPVIARAPDHGNWGVLATARTTALTIAVVLMALLARGDRVREAGWLIYPLLIATGVKILVEDFRQSQPATLFVALIFYGSALLVGPRLASK